MGQSHDSGLRSIATNLRRFNRFVGTQIDGPNCADQFGLQETAYNAMKSWWTRGPMLRSRNTGSKMTPSEGTHSHYLRLHWHFRLPLSP